MDRKKLVETCEVISLIKELFWVNQGLGAYKLED